MLKQSILKTRSVTSTDGIPGVVTYGLQYLAGNSDAYFTLTAWFSGWDKKHNRHEFGGMCHEEILAVAPDLEIFARLHLSDSEGVPMHSVENGLYFAGRGKYSQYAPKTLAKHLRISDEAADSLADNTTKEEFIAFVESLKPGWKKEAGIALDKLGK